jgi:hypothetical protein
MTTDLQRQTVPALAEVCSLSPDVRLGQLLAHLGFLGEIHVGKGLGYIEDDEMLAIIYRHRAELVARSAGHPEEAPNAPGAATSISGSPTLPEPLPVSKRS